MGPAARLLEHPHLTIFGIVLASQMGLPLPADPFLLAAGALAAKGNLSLLRSVATVVVATFLSDSVWYQAGRRRGSALLRFLCRISLEPDSCVRRTEDFFGRHGARAVVMAKFVPGLGTVAAPMAGMLGMGRARFSLFALASALLWALTLETLGYVFSDSLTAVMAVLSRLAGGLSFALGGLLVAYILGKYVQRQRFIRSLRIARITPEELKERLDRGEDIVVVDLRHPAEFEMFPETIPGALRIGPHEMEERHAQIPRGQDVVVFCT
ncbi:MAG TPA: VTT domain-containing protein [Vicinamibacteria bacterium]|jgi:membrane protein DedA with SNARE-associated domain|nr:VTT domain-containing protein [Vicinamibacteria bacterium]